jgi:CubicO group peptidase (beta-lactamase class C family)
LSFTRRHIVTGLGAVLVGAPAQAGVLPAFDLEAERIRRGAPALGIGGQRGRDAAQVRVTGVRSSREANPVSPDARWHLGSLTKAFTATLAARAVEGGWIDWTSSIGDTLGPMVEGMREAYAGVSLLQLLSHRSGLPPDIPRAAFDRFSRTMPADPRAERLHYALIALGQEPVAAPGTQMAYANNGYVVAGAMLEARMGAPWEALVQDWVLNPLGLTSAGFGPPTGRHDPSGHIVASDGQRIPVAIDNPVAMGPAGRLHMSLPDLLRFLTAHRDRDPALMRRASWDALHIPHFGGDYALGWIVLPDGRLWHNGSNGLWYAEAVIGRNAVAALAQNDGAAIAGVPSAALKAAMG